MFAGPFSESIIARAQKQNKVKIKILNLRDQAKDKHKTVDDKPYGGGKGMILKVDIVVRTLEKISPKPYSILLSASGKKFNQKIARILSKKASIALICGHYEGVDARVEKFVEETLSLGDFVLSGGEIASMAIVDSIIRLIPSVIHPQSLQNESFGVNPYLEYPQFTRPANFKNLKVPKILLSGNHREIKKWRDKEALKRVYKFRPDLLKKPTP